MSPPLDWLSRLLQMTPVRGQLDLRCQYGAPWRIDQDAFSDGEMAYHIVLDGSASLVGENGEELQRIVAGDILLIPNGEAHTLHDGTGSRPRPAKSRVASNLVFSQNAGRGEHLDMLCGRFVLTPAHARLLRRYLPKRLIVQTRNSSITTEADSGTALIRLVSLMQSESAADRLGGRAMLDALSTALFTITLRFASELEAAPPGLLSLAGFPRLAPALDAIFHDPGQAWTLPVLAARCNMSRATFVRLFQEKLGMSANDLLTDIRMMLSANELRTGNASTAAIAESVGYQSEAAFQRAFKSHMGVTPSRWRKQSMAGEGGERT
ncbi:AraC family transcriptional regulator [Luteibacter pinisoli]|uniref:AraC family transcriptional regulator n=1 Tax=Luteibacter pinisoli TaxID=2589080 RepID=A0A4Y5YXM2_9GAMM|nr:AraC family transcriptional regulator [Luteibacter pinisoli]QDE37712.1 AraC family transcriptional regulator [Luteibacter pinisoli]